jgi:hypothetical protein
VSNEIEDGFIVVLYFLWKHPFWIYTTLNDPQIHEINQWVG